MEHKEWLRKEAAHSKLYFQMPAIYLWSIGKLPFPSPGLYSKSRAWGNERQLVLWSSFRNSVYKLQGRGTPPLLGLRVAGRVLVLWPGVRPEPLRWESRVQDTGPPETSRPQLISIGKSSPRDLRLTAKTQLHSMTSKLQCWTPHARQLAR